MEPSRKFLNSVDPETGKVQITAIEKGVVDHIGESLATNTEIQNPPLKEGKEEQRIEQSEVLASIRKWRFSPPENSPESNDLLREDRQRDEPQPNLSETIER